MARRAVAEQAFGQMTETSDFQTAEPTAAYVWVWLPEATEPVVAARLRADGELITFTSGQSYLRREAAAPCAHWQLR